MADELKKSRQYNEQRRSAPALVDAVQRWWNRTTEPEESPQYGDLLADPEPDREIGQVY